MNMKIVESSLNLRIEYGKKKEDYTLSKHVAEKQLSFAETDIYTNVEFMDCDNSEYLQTFEQAGYNSFISLDSKGRGVLCEVKNCYEVQKLGEMSKPHMLHLRIKRDATFIDLITVRLLVAGGDDADFKGRRRQWQRILNYIESLPDNSHLVLTGDFNHGVISSDIKGYNCRPRQHFNYQMVTSDLERKNITLYPMKGNSYRGYMKIDHIATGKRIVVDTAVYEDIFPGTEEIGIPDHSCIVASVKCV